MVKFNQYPASRIVRGTAALGAALALSQVAACNADPNPGTLQPDGVLVVETNGNAYADQCFTLASRPGNVYTIQMNGVVGFYAGASHFDYAPQLVQENGATKGSFGTTTDIDTPTLAKELSNGTLAPRTENYTNPENGQRVDCQEKWPDDPTGIQPLIGKLAVYGGPGYEVLVGPVDQNEAVNLMEYAAQSNG